MKHSDKKERIDYLIHNVYKLADESLHNTLSMNSYNSFLRRKKRCDIFEAVCDVLDITSNNVFKIRNSFFIQTTISSDIIYFFNSLDKQSKSIIYYLANALYMNEHFPEVFNSED